MRQIEACLKKIVHEQIRNTNILKFLPHFYTSSIFVVEYQWFTKFPIR